MNTNKSDKSLISTCISIGIITITIVIFYLLWVFPDSLIYVTPDFGQSDLFQLNYPAKYMLHTALQSSKLPLWSSLIGTGFPVLAENQAGVFNVFNLIFMKYFSFVQGIQMIYISIALVSAIGSYVYAKFLRFSEPVSILVGFAFAFSGFFVTHHSHLNLIQTASYLPWVFLFVHAFIRTKKLWLLPLLAIVMSQQLFSGFPQLFLYTGIGVGCLVSFSFIRKEISVKHSLFILVTGLSVLLLTAIQVLPTSEFVSLTERSGGYSLDIITQYSFTVDHLKSFLSPRALGSAENGSYSFRKALGGSIFWENNGYLGLIPLMASVIALVSLSRKDRRKSEGGALVMFYTALGLLAFLLMLGKSSPLYFLYTLPPLNYFRVPSRFILLAIWSLVVLAGFGISHIEERFFKHKSFSWFVFSMSYVAVSVYFLFVFALTYPARGSADDWLKKPDVATYLLSTDTQQRTYSVGTPRAWNEVFFKKGWEDTHPYEFMQNAIMRNMNVMFDIPSTDVYRILVTKRFKLVSDSLERGTRTDADVVEFDAVAKKILKMTGVKYIISPNTISEAEPAYATTSGNLKMGVYAFEDAPRTHLIQEFRRVNTTFDLSQALHDPEWNPDQIALVEKDIDLEPIVGENDFNASLIKDENEEVVFEVHSKNPGLFVLADLYYPGWNAYVDGKQSEIYATNGIQRGVLIDKGNHIIVFEYKPTSFMCGMYVSILAHLVIILLGIGFYRFRSE